MKKCVKKVNMMSSVTTLALLITTFAANMKCIYIFHQPEQNAKIKTLRKF